MPIDRNAIETAVQAWLAATTGLDPSKITLTNAKIPQPVQPYLELTIPEPQRVGGQDEVRWAYDAAAPAGQEMTATVYGEREFVARVQAFTAAATGNLDAQGSLTAANYLSRAQTGIRRPSVHQALQDAGLAFIRVEAFNDLSGRRGPFGGGRAQMDVRFRCVDTQDDTPTGFINTSTPVGTLTPQ